jgi:hypothetical protein
MAKQSPNEPSRVSRQNAGHAYMAIAHVRAQLPLVDRHRPLPRDPGVTGNEVGAWLSGRFEQIWPIRAASELEAGAEDDVTTTALVHRLADAARRARAGRAGEAAALAFAYLHALGVRPLDFMCCPGRERAFVVIGRRPPAPKPTDAPPDAEAPVVVEGPHAAESRSSAESWGPDAVLCDPHDGVVYTQPELVKSDAYFQYQPCESELSAPAARHADEAYD